METFNISSTDLRDDALDDMMRRIHLDSQNLELLERENEREMEQEQLRWRADQFIHAMSLTENRQNVSINLNPADVFQYNTSTPIDQLRPMMSARPVVDEYNYLQNIKAPVPPK